MTQAEDRKLHSFGVALYMAKVKGNLQQSTIRFCPNIHIT